MAIQDHAPPVAHSSCCPSPSRRCFCTPGRLAQAHVADKLPLRAEQQLVRHAAAAAAGCLELLDVLRGRGTARRRYDLCNALLDKPLRDASDVGKGVCELLLGGSEGQGVC
jgi:hypothetical protein